MVPIKLIVILKRKHIQPESQSFHLYVRIESVSFRLLIVMRSQDPHLQNWWQQTQFLKSAGGTILKAGGKKNYVGGPATISFFNLTLIRLH